MRNENRTPWTGPGAAPPSMVRSDPRGWAAASACAGAAVGLAVLALLWRPLPWLPDCAMGLSDQLWRWAMALVGRGAGEGNPGMPPFLGAQPTASLADWGMRLRVCAASLAAFVPGAMMWRGFMEARDGLIHLRGALRLAGSEAVRAMRATFAQAAAQRPDHDIAPGVPFPAEMWCAHVFLCAGTGGGKSTFLRALLRKIFDADEPAIVFDPKGEFVESFGAAALIAPWDARSWAWDIGRDLRNVADMRRYAESVVDASTDPMWANSSRQILVGLLKCLRSTRGSDWGFPDLADMLALPQSEVADVMRGHAPEALRLVEKATATAQGILINLAASCAPIFDLALAWRDVPAERRLSFVSWTQGGPCPKQVILQGHGSYRPLTRAFARPIVEVVAGLLASPEMTDDETRKRWLICDECPALGKCDLPLVVEQGRSRGFRCVLACQDFLQMEEVHGERVARSLVGMVGTVVIGRVSPGHTAEKLAQAIGSREVERPNVSTSSSGGAGSGESTTRSFSREQVAVYLPSELSSRLGPRSDRGGVVMALLTAGNSHELFWPFVKLAKERPRMVAAPWTLGVEPAAERAAPTSDDADVHPTDFDAGAADDPAPLSGGGDPPEAQPCSAREPARVAVDQMD